MMIKIDMEMPDSCCKCMMYYFYNYKNIEFMCAIDGQELEFNPLLIENIDKKSKHCKLISDKE